MANPLLRRNLGPQGPFPQANPQQPAGLGNGGNLMERMIFNRLYQTNPQFRQIADSVRGMTPEQAFQAHGYDYNQYRNVGLNQIRQMLGF